MVGHSGHSPNEQPVLRYPTERVALNLVEIANTWLQIAHFQSRMMDLFIVLLETRYICRLETLVIHK